MKISSFGSLWILSPLLLVSCQFHVGGLIEYSRVQVEILNNDTERRTHEFDLSSAIMQELSGAGIAVNSPASPVKLKGRILSFDQPPAVESGDDVVIVGSVQIGLEISLVENKSGKVLWTDRKVETADFSTQRLESAENARQEVFDRLARWVLTKLEKDWE